MDSDNSSVFDSVGAHTEAYGVDVSNATKHLTALGSLRLFEICLNLVHCGIVSSTFGLHKRGDFTSHGMRTAAAQPHHSRPSNSKGKYALEDEQSVFVARDRCSDGGPDADLTELAALQVVGEHKRSNNLEHEEVQAEEQRNGEFELAEVGAPKPVPSSEPSGYRSGSRQPDEEKFESRIPVTEKDLSHWTEIVTLAWLVFFSLFGTLARLGVEAIATHPYAAVSSPVLWANMAGSGFLGFLVEDRCLFRYPTHPHLSTDDEEENKAYIDRRKKTLPLYIGLATGFCGSFTSFSTFITDAFLALFNSLPPPDPTSPYHTIGVQTMHSRNGGYSFMEVMAILILHPAISISALKTGAHLAAGLSRLTPSLPTRLIHQFLDPLAVLLGPGCWIGAILLSVWPISTDWRDRATMALVFAPPGCLLRFYLARTLNARVPAFPLGTFAANVFGTCIEGMCYDLQHSTTIVGNVVGRANSCAVLEGFIQGFCGCTTTVSTWVVELNGLRRNHAWIYGFTSVVVALGLQVAIMGSVGWSIGFDQSCKLDF